MHRVQCAQPADTIMTSCMRATAPGLGCFSWAVQRVNCRTLVDGTAHTRSRRKQPSGTALCASFLDPVLSAVPVESLTAAHPGLAVGAAVTTAVFVFGLPVLLSGLTPAGVLTAWLLGTFVFAAFGPGGFGLVCVYFILGSGVTKFKLKEKTEKGIAEARGGKRGPVRILMEYENCACSSGW